MGSCVSSLSGRTNGYGGRGEDYRLDEGHEGHEGLYAVEGAEVVEVRCTNFEPDHYYWTHL